MEECLAANHDGAPMPRVGGLAANREARAVVLGDSPAASACAASASSVVDQQRSKGLEDAVAALQVQCADLQRQNEDLQKSVQEVRDQNYGWWKSSDW